MFRLRALSLSVVFVFVCGLGFLTPLAHGQYRASLHGTVTDPSGALVSGATATLLNPATNQKMVETTDPAGIYHFNALPPGSYQLTINASGSRRRFWTTSASFPSRQTPLTCRSKLAR